MTTKFRELNEAKMKPGQSKHKRAIPDDRVIDVARAWFVEKAAVRDIAKRIGVSADAVARCVRAQGLYSTPWVDAVVVLIKEGHTLDRKKVAGVEAWR